MLLRKLPIRRVIQTRALSALSSSSAPHAPNISPNPKPKPQPNANANANANLNPNPSAGSQKAPRGVATFAVTVPLEPSSLSPDSLKVSFPFPVCTWLNSSCPITYPYLNSLHET